jgi:hypothetical protein
MANVKISDLTAAAAALGTQEFEVNESGTSKKVTGAQIATYVIGADAELSAISSLAVTDGNFIVGNGTTWVAESDSTARTSLGLGSIATQAANNVDIDGGAIDGVTIGGASAGAGTFTTLTATGDVDVADKIVHTGDTNTAIRFPAADTVTVETAGVERMRISSGGNVGIGATSPACLFHAYGGNSGASFATAGLGRFESNGDVLVHWGTPTANQAIIRHATALDQESAAIVMDGTSRYMSFHTVNGIERMRINNGGNISIGTTTVNARLTVDGAVTLTNQAYAYYAQSGGAAITGYVTGQSSAYSIWASNRVSAEEFNSRSDRRLKKDIAEISAQDAVAFVQTVPPVRYKWKGSEDNGDKFGFLAQDIVKAGFPHLVGQYPNQNLEEDSDKDGFVSPAGVMLTISYDQIVPVLSAALKEAFAEIANLKARVAEIESSKGDAA